MNIDQFLETYKSFKDADKIQITCDHPLHAPVGELIPIGKQPAKRNIWKNGGKEFICRDCMMKYNNPMTHVGVSRQTSEIIDVYCPHPEHEGEPSRQIQKSAYYGSLEEPYLQVCGSCVQLGKVISEEQKEAIRIALTGIKRSEEFKEKLRQYMKNNEEGIARAEKNLIPGSGGGWNKGIEASEETKKKMSDAKIGKTFDEEHCQNISIGRKKMLEETGGFTQEHKDKLRKATLEQYANGFNPHAYHLNGWHESPIAGRVFHRSSYECKAFEKLDSDPEVATYKVEKTSVDYIDPTDGSKRTYLIDIEVNYKDGRIKFVEVKAAKLLQDPIVVAKVNAGQEYAKTINATYETWTEVELFGFVYNEKRIRDYVDKLKIKLARDKGEDLTEDQLKEEKKAKNREKANCHYDKHKDENKVTIHCDYCDDDHTIAGKQYDSNIAKNGRYICPVENGSLTGKKAKPKLKPNNPFAAEGKKQCTGNGSCGLVLPFESFSPDSSRRDGYCDMCKACRRKKAAERYKNKPQ